MRKDATAPLLALAAALLLAAPARADVFPFGSDLSKPADVMLQNGSDTAYWQTWLPSTGAMAIPADGQILSVKVRGFADSDVEWRFEDGPPFPGGERLFHVQVLQPQHDGTMRIRKETAPGDPATWEGTSNHLYLPGLRQGATKDTITEFPLENLCVAKGDLVAFNHIGGHSPAIPKFHLGTPLHVFAPAPGAAMDVFRATDWDQTHSGMTLSPKAPEPGKELLMQLKIGTGPDAFYECPGGTYNPYKAGGPLGPPAPAPPPPKPETASVPVQRVTISSRGKAVVTVFCQSFTAACTGQVQLVARRTRQVLARQRFEIPSRRTGRVNLKLTRAGLRAFLKARRRLPATVVATTDGKGAASFAVTLRKRGT